MKKVLSLVFTICLVLSITACKKETVNKEYSEYSEKVVTVLADYGIETSNSNSKKAVTYTESKSNNTVVTASCQKSNSNGIILLSNESSSTTNFSDSKSIILDKLNNSEHTPKDLTNSIQDAFEQTFYFPLVMGRALTDSLKVTSFYGETACVANNQFIVTNKNGAHNITYAYIENGYENNGNHHYVVIDLDYTDINNYEFIMVSYDENESTKSFYYGNDNQEFIHLYISDSLKYVEYQDKDKNGYIYEQSNFADDIYALIADEFSKYEKKTFTDLKTNSKHDITEAAYADAMEKYFGYTGPTYTSGLSTHGDCALYYIATNNEETITIPDNIKYLSPYFEVIDTTGKVKTLVIPNSIIGIKEGDSVLPLERLELRLTTDNKDRLFENIIVEEGSPLFKSDGFKLTSYDEKILFYIMGNNSSETLDLSMCTKTNNNIMRSTNFAVFKGVKTLKYNLLDMNDGDGQQIDLLSEYAGYCWNNNISFKVKFDELIIGNIKSDMFITDNVMDMSSDNYITKLTLNGNINEWLYITDGNGIIKDIVINSPNKTQITGVLNGITKIEIDSNEWVGFSSENIREVVICEGVTETSLNHLYGNVAEELTIYLPSTLKNFVGELPEIPQGSVGKYKIIAKMSPALINGEFEELLRNFDSDNQWVIEYDMSAEEHQMLNDFKEIVNYSEQENALDIKNYFGSDSVVFVPSTIAGVQVRAFRLDNSDISYDNVGQHQTIASVKEIHLPYTLTGFSITYNDSYDENYHIDKIYYNGNYSDFETIFFTDISYLFEFELCEQLICNDKTITKDSFLSSWEYETSTIEDGNVVCNFSNIIVSYDEMKGKYYISGNVYNNTIYSEMQYLIRIHIVMRNCFRAM